jgi:hypothetical protein
MVSTFGDFDEVSKLFPLVLLPGLGLSVDPDCAEELEELGEVCAFPIVLAQSNVAQAIEAI